LPLSNHARASDAFGYLKFECAVRYLGIDVDDAIEIAEKIEI
jgi:hypothetical protein